MGSKGLGPWWVQGKALVGCGATPRNSFDAPYLRAYGAAPWPSFLPLRYSTPMLSGILTVGGWTMASRILGFARDILIAALLGAGPVADAFFVANRLPNLFRRLFGEGAFNAAFVPGFAGLLATDGPDAARRFAEQAIAVMAFWLFGLTVLAEMFMPQLMAVLRPGVHRGSRTSSRSW